MVVMIVSIVVVVVLSVVNAAWIQDSVVAVVLGLVLGAQLVIAYKARRRGTL